LLDHYPVDGKQAIPQAAGSVPHLTIFLLLFREEISLQKAMDGA